MDDLCWTAYAVWVNDAHDKFYTITVSLEDDGSAVEVRRWGRRPDTGSNGQRSLRAHTTVADAIASAQTKMALKIHKGYRERLAAYVVH
jgi:predicted DNA-binding WGR domain protein